ncbi:hypothetical protein MMPV_007443 [Pyropia vietnamensis]
MKLKRTKEARKALTFYRASYGLSPPYRVLVDGPMAVLSLTRSMYLKEGLASLLDTASPVLVTSACVRRELAALVATRGGARPLGGRGDSGGGRDGDGGGGGGVRGGGTGPDLSGALLFLKRVQTVKCAHPGGGSVPASDCIVSLVGGGAGDPAGRASGNGTPSSSSPRGRGKAPHPLTPPSSSAPAPPAGLLVATNDDDLVRRLRAIPGVPLIRVVNQTALRMETPSTASVEAAANAEAAKDALSPAERAALAAVVGSGGGVMEVAKKKRRHGSRKAKAAEPP